MLQTVLFPREYYTYAKALEWLKRKKLKHHKVDVTYAFYRFRQTPPRKWAKFRTIKLPNGIDLVYMTNFRKL